MVLPGTRSMDTVLWVVAIAVITPWVVGVVTMILWLIEAAR